MEIYTAIAKHGIAVVVGFLLGLVAIATIEPSTVNGRLLLMLTTMALSALVGEIVLFVIRRLHDRDSGKSG